MTRNFELVEPMKGIRCSMDHKGLEPTATSFSSTMLEHMKEWHPAIHETVVRMNKEGTRTARQLANAKREE